MTAIEAVQRTLRAGAKATALQFGLAIWLQSTHISNTNSNTKSIQELKA
jgi:hypothetical protein